MKEIKYYKAKYIIVWDKGQHKTLENGYLGSRGRYGFRILYADT